MLIQLNLEEGRFVKRYKRFFAEIESARGTITAHVPNTGSLKSCLKEGASCRYLWNDDPKRKLKATLEMIQTPQSWVGVNTARANQLVKLALAQKLIPAWSEYPFNKPEFKINAQTRLDFVLWKFGEEAPKMLPESEVGVQDGLQKELHFIEVKSVTYASDGTALFPDAETLRGQKHLRELMELKQKGFSVELCFVIQRMDTTCFQSADDIDPAYGALLRQAAQAGVRVSTLQVELNEKGYGLQAKCYRRLQSDFFQMTSG